MILLQIVRVSHGTHLVKNYKSQCRTNFKVLSRRFPPPPKKILLSLQYISNYSGKIIQTRQGQCTHCNIYQNCVSKCTRLHFNAYSFNKFFGEHAPGPPPPPRKLIAFGHSGLLPTNDKSLLKSNESRIGPLCNVTGEISKMI